MVLGTSCSTYLIWLSKFLLFLLSCLISALVMSVDHCLYLFCFISHSCVHFPLSIFNDPCRSPCWGKYSIALWYKGKWLYLCRLLAVLCLSILWHHWWGKSWSKYGSGYPHPHFNCPILSPVIDLLSVSLWSVVSLQSQSRCLVS